MAEIKKVCVYRATVEEVRRLDVHPDKRMRHSYLVATPEENRRLAMKAARVVYAEGWWEEWLLIELEYVGELKAAIGIKGLEMMIGVARETQLEDIY